MTETQEKAKKSIFSNPLLSTKVKSANAKFFPEGVLGYFIGPTLALLANSILSSYFNQYMSDVLRITGWNFGQIFFTWLPVVSVIFVVLGNILVGRLIDRNPTKAGKARPLILLSVPVSVVALLLLFVLIPNPEGISANQQVLAMIIVAVGYNLWFGFAYPLYYTPHSALVNLSTRNSKDRSLLATISNATALAAMGLSSMILPFFLGLLFKREMDISKIPEGATEIINQTTGAVEGYKLGDAIIYDQAASYHAWMIFVIALVVITAIGALIEYYFTRERVTEETLSSKVSLVKKVGPTFKEQAKICFKDKFWWLIIVFFFLYQLGGMMKNVSQLYYCAANFADNGAYGLDVGGTFSGTIGIVGAIPTALGMVLAWPLSNKIGKGKAILLGAIVSVLGGVLGFFADGNFALAVTAFVIKALGSTPAMYLSLALLADILDHQEAMHGKRTDGFTMMIYGAVMAGMTGIATGIMNGVLAGFDVGAVGFSYHDVALPMTFIFFGGETICYFVIILLFLFMKVEKFSKFDHKAITMDQMAKAAAEGVEYVDPAEKLKQEEAEAELASEEARKAELKARCEKKGLSYEEEEAKYEAKRAEALAKQEQKRAAAEAKKAAAEAEKAQKYAALSDEQKAELERKAALAEQAAKEREARVLEEFNEIRKRNGKPVLE